MLSERQKKILKLIVESYIRQAKPVSSNQLSYKLKCSSATVRSEMAGLEELGYLEKTHTSSGRVPSEEGYRYYVDNLMEAKKINGEEMLKLQIIFHNQSLELSDCINKSLQVISDMTSYTAVVLGKASHENLLKEVRVVPLDTNHLIVIVVTDKGKVEHKNITLEMKDNVINVIRKDDEPANKSLHGLTRTLINNMIIGVKDGYKKELQINGVGYRVQKQGNNLNLTLGYSHPVVFEAPAGITFDVPDANTIIVKGIDKELVGQTAAVIREKRAPEVYGGKGIKYDYEVIRRKEGKAGKK